MVDADVGLLLQVQSERLVWTGGSAYAQDKTAFAQCITNALTMYQSVESTVDSCIAAPGAVVLTGTVDITASIGGTEHK